MPPSPPDQRHYHALPMSAAHEHDYAPPPHQYHLPAPHQPRASIFGRLGSMHADPLGHVHDPQHDVYHRQGQHFGGFEMLADVSAMVERPAPRCLGMPAAESDEMEYAPPTPDDDVPMLGSSSATVRVRSCSIWVLRASVNARQLAHCELRGSLTPAQPFISKLRYMLSSPKFSPYIRCVVAPTTALTAQLERRRRRADHRAHQRDVRQRAAALALPSLQHVVAAPPAQPVRRCLVVNADAAATTSSACRRPSCWTRSTASAPRASRRPRRATAPGGIRSSSATTRSSASRSGPRAARRRRRPRSSSRRRTADRRSRSRRRPSRPNASGRPRTRACRRLSRRHRARRRVAGSRRRRPSTRRSCRRRRR